MDSARVEITLVPHGFEVDVLRNCQDMPGQELVASYCFDFGDDYKPRVLAGRLGHRLVEILRAEPKWLCLGASRMKGDG